MQTSEDVASSNEPFGCSHRAQLAAGQEEEQKYGHPVTGTIPLSACSASQSKQGGFPQGDNPIIPTESSAPPKWIFPLLLLQDSIKKKEITSSCGSSISEHF